MDYRYFIKGLWHYYPKYDFCSACIGIGILVLAGGALLQSSLKTMGVDKRKMDKDDSSIIIDQSLLDKIYNARK